MNESTVLEAMFKKLAPNTNNPKVNIFELNLLVTLLIGALICHFPVLISRKSNIKAGKR
jgi:hypothetical protein